MKSLKIGILTEIINFHSGSRAPLEIARHLSILGQKVTVYAYNTMLDNRAKTSLQKDGVKIRIIKRFNLPYFGKYVSTIALFKILKKNPPDIITFSGTLPFFIAAKISGIPIIRVYMGTQFDAYLERKNPDEKIFFWEKAINKLTNLYIFISELIPFKLSTKIVSISNFAKREGEILYRRKVEKTIYLGTSNFPISKKVFLKNSDTINIISVSRITPYKGFHKIIEAIKNVKTKKKIILTIAGSQPKQHYLSYLKKIGGDNLNIVLNPSDTQLAKIFRNADIYTCADRYLYFGLPICEAAYFNLPTVTLNIAAAPEIVEHNKTGYVANSQAQFSKYIEKLTNNPTLCSKMGKAANKRAQNFFSWKKAALNYQMFLRDVAEKSL